MIKELGLEEEDLDDVVFQQETNMPTKAILWMSIARVNTDCEYNKFWI